MVEGFPFGKSQRCAVGWSPMLTLVLIRILLVIILLCIGFCFAPCIAMIPGVNLRETPVCIAATTRPTFARLSTLVILKNLDRR